MKYILLITLLISACTHTEIRVPAKEIYKNFSAYENKKITLTGNIDLRHFESVNIDGVHIDWLCTDPSNPDESAEKAFTRLDEWRNKGASGQYGEITGTLIYGHGGGIGSYSMPVIHLVEHIKFGNTLIPVQCKFPQQ